MSETREVDAEVTTLSRREASTLAPMSTGFALGQMSQGQFEQMLEHAVNGRQRLQKVMRALMSKGVHYGPIPGTDGRNVLLKPGAEVICQTFRLVCDTKTEVIYGDGHTAPQITVQARTQVHHNSLDGPVVGVGEAAANSWEKKWRYRTEQRKCPNCGQAAIIKGKAEYGGGWLCWNKAKPVPGCGAKWPEGAPEIEAQEVGQIENPDPFDLLNTIVKIAAKRAKMSGVIDATASSDLLAPEHPELPEEQDQESEAKPNPKAAGKAGSAAREPAPAKPAADDRLAYHRRRLFAQLQQMALLQLAPNAVLSNEEEGTLARRVLLEAIVQRDVLELADLKEPEWESIHSDLDVRIHKVGGTGGDQPAAGKSEPVAAQ